MDADVPSLIDEEEQANCTTQRDVASTLVVNSDDSESADDDDEDDDSNAEPTKCLFCEKILNNIDLAIEHLRAQHKLDLRELQTKFQMDQYAFIKLINCIRRDHVDAEKVLTATTAFWNDDAYLKPGQYEPWLTYDYESLCSLCAQTNNGDALNFLQQRVQHYEQLLEQAREDMDKMRATIHTLMELDKTVTPNHTRSVASKSVVEDEGYFSSYAHFSIHHEMLSDKVRTNSYRNALLQNTDFIRDKHVLDVGCGTAILSIFASQAGAQVVVGIDNSDIVYNAMDIVQKHGVNNVKLIKGRLEDTVLPQEKYDIIISEWMGYYLLFEGMLDSVIYARERHLKPGGILLPNRCTMSLLGLGDEELYRNHVTFWDDVYGLNMSSMRKQVLHEPLIDIANAKHILTEAEIISNLNLATVSLNYSNFSYTFNLKCKKAGKLSAFVGYFDTYFELPQAVHFSTSPYDTPTHWKQVIFFLEQPIIVQENDIVSGTLTCKRSHSNARSLDITIETAGQKHGYYLD